MKLLLVGDPHVTVEELDDSQALLDGVFGLYSRLAPDKVILLGDLHHNHALVRVEVTDFWLKNLSRFNKDKVVLILGNHDRPNDSSSVAHALQSYTNIAQVIDKTTYWPEAKIALAPYKHDKEDLVNDICSLQKLGKEIKVLVCHQTFDGSKYENGFYAPDGLDARLLGVKSIVSGHIHTRMNIGWEDGFVSYIGSPRWRSISDANETKAVVLYDTEAGTFQYFDTSEWCSPISKASITNVNELSSIKFIDNERTRFYIDVVGAKANVEVEVKNIKSKLVKAKIRPVYTDQNSSKLAVTESEGVVNALRRYIKGYKSIHGTSNEMLSDMVARRLKIG